MNSTISQSQQFEQHYSGILADYVTAIAWSPQGEILAAISAAGEVVLWNNGQLTSLQTVNGKSVDCLAFSPDGKFLAVGGQDGQVKIWQDTELIATLQNAPAWVDKLAWNYTSNQLAFSLGRYVQVWDADTREIVVTLNFDNSSVLGIDWRIDGQYLAIAGYKGVKIWHSQNWDDEPYILDMPTVSLAMAWSPDGKFLASGNMDRSVTVLEWNNPDPWVMRGFPGKIRQLAWSEATTNLGAPILASSSVEGIVVWEKLEDDNLGWEARVLTNHVDVINAIAFAPKSFLLASAGADGWLCLWNRANEVSQIITGVSGGFSSLAWHPQGKLLAAGGEKGELIIWSETLQH
ncbi:WD40 repeat-containing protein [Nostoc linckia z18]|uniref:WD40 repeat-containing protein n=2 Tax=Nostoc linckia TaxID=92942 RepID=A0A9Q5ZG26_NOSLI|nr:WD40 repeat domain-containing protein [Nostoc linckia]PHK38690.1 WD40 repeat-containing protein [Nostoc linckia z15]PHK43906.1 WD40 repeat-containing protein [Nostoc linckia z16]PHJ63730.1 WD40 repeat-containing protein [Nostoc linckia z1]PHJ69336.1 WD40 repeat-containing protein [Nostoc linckia z3]PHJ72465.1 WD40 repeat-containing protein [Nostoc linckia z2]